MVIWHHRPVARGIGHGLAGWGGVWLFFVLSAYVICLVWQPLVPKADWSDGNQKKIYRFFGAFFSKRFLRIVPLGLVALIGTVGVHALIANVPFHVMGSSLWSEIRSILLGVHNFWIIRHPGQTSLGPYWSLSIEEQFYTVFPLFLLLFSQRKERLLILCYGSLFVEWVIRPLMIYRLHPGVEGDWPFLRANTFFVLDCFLLGAAIHFCEIEPKMGKCMDRVGSRWPILKRIVFPIFVFAIMKLSYQFVQKAQSITITIMVFLCVCLVALASARRDWISVPRLIDPLTNWIGRRSYILYLLYQPVCLLGKWITLGICQNLSWKPDSVMSRLLEVSLLILQLGAGSELGHRLIERPCLGFGKKISTRLLHGSWEETSENPAKSKAA